LTKSRPCPGFSVSQPMMYFLLSPRAWGMASLLD
jgi:hypothetical protein